MRAAWLLVLPLSLVACATSDSGPDETVDPGDEDKADRGTRPPTQYLQATRFNLDCKGPGCDYLQLARVNGGPCDADRTACSVLVENVNWQRTRLATSVIKSQVSQMAESDGSRPGVPFILRGSLRLTDRGYKLEVTELWKAANVSGPVGDGPFYLVTPDDADYKRSTLNAKEAVTISDLDLDDVGLEEESVEAVHGELAATGVIVSGKQHDDVLKVQQVYSHLTP